MPIKSKGASMSNLLINDKVRLLKVMQILGSVESEMKLQKIVYLIQQLSRKHKHEGFNYGFIFYSYGAHSKELQKDLINIERQTGYIIQGRLNQKEQK